MKSSVCLIKGENRRENARKSLEGISEEIISRLKGRRVVIKPDLHSADLHPTCAHVDQVRGVLDFLKAVHKDKILVAEASAENTWKIFKRLGYAPLEAEYGVELVDLNAGPFRSVTLRDAGGKALKVRVSGLLMDEATFLVSAARLKTHEKAGVALSIHSAALGGVFSPDKAKVHQGEVQAHRNIAELARRLWPDLSVLDGLEGREEGGPLTDQTVRAGVALAGTDPLAVDRLACQIMGVDFNQTGYLSRLSQAGRGASEMKNIRVLGDSWEECSAANRPQP